MSQTAESAQSIVPPMHSKFWSEDIYRGLLRNDIGEFHSAHGYDPVIVNQWYVYEDGARRHVRDCDLIELPHNDHIKQQWRWQYYTTRLNIAEEQLGRLCNKGVVKGDSFDAAMFDILIVEVELRRRALAAFEKADREAFATYAAEYAEYQRSRACEPQESAA